MDKSLHIKLPKPRIFFKQICIKGSGGSMKTKGLLTMLKKQTTFHKFNLHSNQ